MFLNKYKSIAVTFPGFILLSVFWQFGGIEGNPLRISPDSLNISPDLEILHADLHKIPNVLRREGRAAADKHALLDKVNIDNYLRNKRAVNQQIKCILKDGPCDTIGKEIKRLIPTVLRDSNICPECSPSQLEKIQKIIDHLKTNYPAEWLEIDAKYGGSLKAL